MRFINLKPEYLATAAAAVILFCVLMMRPITGVADNGDFPRIMGSTGLQYMTSDYNERYFGFVNRLYAISPGIPAGGGYLSTEIPIVLFAVVISQLIRNTWIFDIRYLSLTYSLIFLFSIFLIVRSSREKPFMPESTLNEPFVQESAPNKFFTPVPSGKMPFRLKSFYSNSGITGWLTAFLVVFVFADTGYISYFNSLYGEAVSLVFLLLAAGSGLYLATCEKPKLWALICFYAGAVFFTGAKLQNCPVGLLAGLLGLRMLNLRSDRMWKRTILLSAAVVVIVSFTTYASVSKDIKVCNKYQSVFYGVLKNSPDPAGDLEELGLDPGLAVLAGTNYFMENYPIDIRSETFKNELFDKVSPFKIAVFYLKHPGRLLDKLGIAAGNGFKLKQGFGNFEKYPGVVYKQTTNVFSAWSDFKMNAMPHTLLFVVLYFILFFAAAAVEYARCKNAKTRLFIELLAVIGIIGIVQLAVPVIGDGEADLSKHLFLFNVCFDIIFITGSVYLVYRTLTSGRLLMKFIRNTYAPKI